MFVRNLFTSFSPALTSAELAPRTSACAAIGSCCRRAREAAEASMLRRVGIDSMPAVCGLLSRVGSLTAHAALARLSRSTRDSMILSYKRAIPRSIL